MLTTFIFDDVTRTFQLYSDNPSQAGTYTIHLNGTLNANPANVAQTMFNVHVADPCSSATLTAPASLFEMTMTMSVIASGS